jgi:hypothetical protein
VRTVPMGRDSEIALGLGADAILCRYLNSPAGWRRAKPCVLSAKEVGKSQNYVLLPPARFPFPVRYESENYS